MLVTYLRRDQKKNVELALGGLSSINSILRQQQTYRVRRDDENNVAWLMVNTEKTERGCRRWRAVLDRIYRRRWMCELLDIFID